MVRFDLEVTDGHAVVVEKMVALATSRDPAVASPRDGTLAEQERADYGFAELLGRHVLAWQRLWEHFAVTVDTDDRHVGLAIALNAWQYFQATWTPCGSPNEARS